MTTLVARRGVGGVDNRRTNFDEAEKREVYKAAPVSTFLQTQYVQVARYCRYRILDHLWRGHATYQTELDIAHKLL